MSSKNKLKVAFIHPDLGIGGAERLVLDVAGAFVKQGHEVVFLTNHFDKSHAFEELKDGDYPVQVYGNWLPRNIYGKFQALCAYIRMVYLTIIYVLFYSRSEKPDVYFVDLIPIAIPILKLVNAKVIYYCHHPDLLASNPGGKLKAFYRRPLDWLEVKSTARADVILVNSKYTGSIFRATFPEITKPIDVIYPTIAFSYQEAAKKLTEPKPIVQLVPEISTTPNTVFLSINRFHPAKKLELAINAMDKLRVNPKWEEIFMVMAGGYDPQSQINSVYFAQLEKLVQEKKLEDKVILLKSPSDEIKTELLFTCDCLIYTPVNEHFGIVPLEAMTVSKPVIACNSGGPRETVSHGVTGFLCEPNAESLAEFMGEILDKEKRQKMGAKGKTVLDEKFSYDSFAKSLGEVLQRFNKKDD